MRNFENYSRMEEDVVYLAACVQTIIYNREDGETIGPELVTIVGNPSRIYDDIVNAVKDNAGELLKAPFRHRPWEFSYPPKELIREFHEWVKTA